MKGVKRKRLCLEKLKRHNFIKCIRDKTGTSFPLTAAVALVMLMLLLVICEFMKMMITVSGVKDAYEEAIISVVNDNYNEVYACVREGYAGGYFPTGFSFYSSVDYGNVPGRLESLLGLTENGIYYEKTDPSGNLQYRVSDIDVNVYNTPMARSGDEFYADGTLVFEMPVEFAGVTVTTMNLNLKVRAALKEVF